MTHTTNDFQPGLVAVGRASPDAVVLHLGAAPATRPQPPQCCVVLPERRAALNAYTQIEKLGGHHAAQ